MERKQSKAEELITKKIDELAEVMQKSDKNERIAFKEFFNLCVARDKLRLSNEEMS